MKPKVNIHIGQYFASREPAIIQTILGSCISVCLFDPVKKIGGMNHILHSGKDMVSPDDSARFGINAMEMLINEMTGLGALRSRLVAKIFGGGNILGLPEKYQVGTRNTDFVINFLRTDKIRVLAQNTGGHFSRRLLFHTDTCEAFMKKLNINNYLESEIKIDKKLSSRVKSIPQKAGDITLF